MGRLIMIIVRGLPTFIEFLKKLLPILKENFKSDREEDVKKGPERFVHWALVIVSLLATIDFLLGHRIDDLVEYVNNNIEISTEDLSVNTNSDVEAVCSSNTEDARRIEQLEARNQLYSVRISELREKLIALKLELSSKDSDDKASNNQEDRRDYRNILPYL